MNNAKAHERLIGAVAVVGIFMLCATVLALRGSGPRREMLTDDRAKLVGDWTGDSICVGNNSACHDEKVVYHISKSPDDLGMVIIAADKIVDGKPDPMYLLDFKYDAEKGTLVGEFSNTRYHGVWEYTVKGKTMEGALTLLPARTIARRVRIKKVE